MPAANLGTTIVNVRAQTTQFQRSLNRATRQMRSFGRDARTAARNAALVFGGLAFGGGAIGATVKNLTESATALRELSIASGIGVPRLQELQRVFESDGLAAEQFNRAILRLNRTIGDAAGGEIEYLEAFQSLGIDLRNAQGEIRSTDELLDEIVSSLAQLPPALQASFGNDLFGRAFQSMSTSLARLRDDSDAFNKEIARQAELLPSLTDATATELKAVNQAFTDAGNAAQTYGQLLVASIGPDIIAGIENALRTIRNNADEITRAFQAVARNADLIAGVGLALIFRRVALSASLATGALIRFSVVGVYNLIRGNTSAAVLAANLRTLGKSFGGLVKQIAVVVGGALTLALAVQYVSNAIKGNFSIIDAFNDLLENTAELYQRVAGIFDTEIEVPPIEIPIEAQNPQAALDQVSQAVNSSDIPTIVIAAEVEDFGLADQLRGLENQLDLLRTTGDATVVLAARQQYLGRINEELASTYQELNRALDALAAGGDDLTRSKTRELENQVDSLRARITQLNTQKIDPTVNQEFFTDIARVNREIAQIQGIRQAQVAIDVQFNLGESLTLARNELQSELRFLNQVSTGELSFGVAQVMQEEVATALSELESLRARIAENERLLNLKPDIAEAEKLSAELVLLRDRARAIDLMVVDPSSIQAAAEEVVRLRNEVELYQRSQQFASSVASSFTGALKGIITGAKSGSDAVKGFITSLADLVLQYTVLIPLAQSLSTALSAGFGGFGGVIPGLASGGFGRGLALVGERGPELVDLGSGSRVYSNDQLADAVGGTGQSMIVTNNISINSTDGPGVRRALAEALPAITDASVNRVMSESSRPGKVRQVLRGY